MMPALYCMCKVQSAAGKLDNQHFLAPNRYGPIETGGDKRPVYLGRKMDLILSGVPQYVCLDEEGKITRPPSNKWPKTREVMDSDQERLLRRKKHYPNVDIYRCSVCGAEVVIEGVS